MISSVNVVLCSALPAFRREMPSASVTPDTLLIGPTGEIYQRMVREFYL